jgi:hypothetical protein
MSYSCDKISSSYSKRFQFKQKEGKVKNTNNYRRYSPNNNRFNMQLIPNQETSSSGMTNMTVFKEKEKPFEIPFFSFPVKALEECDVENYFLKKNKKLFESPSVLHEKVSFQKQKDKKIIDFTLFDEKIIFKDINKAYLQDEQSDDGSESTDEKIKMGKALIFQNLEESSKFLKENLINNQENNILSRKIRFANDLKNK